MRANIAAEQRHGARYTGVECLDLALGNCVMVHSVGMPIGLTGRAGVAGGTVVL